MSDTTAESGTIDAVAASLVEEPVKVKQPKPVDEELVQSEEDDADSQTEVDEADAPDDEDVDEGDGDGDVTDDEDEGNDDEADADAEDEDDAERLYTVKVDGRDQQVPLAELLRGYSGQAYIQQGMKQVAATKAEAESVYTALQSERQQLAAFYAAAQQGQVAMQPPRKPDEAMRNTDPIGYFEARITYDDEMEKYQQTHAAMQELSQRNGQAMERAQAAFLADQHRQLTQKIPAFADPKTATKLRDEIRDGAAKYYNYTPDELRGVTDMRVVVVLNDALKYRRLMAGKKPAVPVPPPAATVMKPGARVAPSQGKRVKVEKAKAQMQKTGDVDDVARFLLS